MVGTVDDRQFTETNGLGESDQLNLQVLCINYEKEHLRYQIPYLVPIFQQSTPSEDVDESTWYSSCSKRESPHRWSVLTEGSGF